MTNELRRAEKRPHSRTLFGTNLVDEYAWLRDPGYPEVTDPDILGYLKAENACFDAWKEAHAGTIDTLYDEFVGRIKKDDESVAVKDGPYFYQWRFIGDQQYRCWFRKAEGAGSMVKYLDENVLAQGLDYFNLAAANASPSHAKLAYAVDTDGSERYRIRVRDFDDEGVDDPDLVTNCSGAIVWSADDRGIFYVELSESLRPHRVRYRDLVSGGEDPIVYEESDPAFFVSIGLSRDLQHVLIASGTHETSEYRILGRDEPLGEPMVVLPRKPGVEYSLDAGHGKLFIVINDTHRNFRLVETPISGTEPDNWRELIAGSDAHYLTSVDCFARFLVIGERFGGLKGLRILDLDGGEHRVSLSDEAGTIGLGDNREFETDEIRLGFTSMITPSSVVAYDVNSRSHTVLKEQEIPSGYDKSAYATSRFNVRSHDGVEVPVTIVHGRDFKPDGGGKLLLYGYGSYGMGMYPHFSTSRISLLDRGFAFAVAHVRGGDELGYGWYESGKKAQKTNTFHDFIACAEGLIERGYASAGRIAIMGGSAGGMLVGAVANMRPDLWRCVIAQVPFVDVVNTMLDDTLPLTPIEWPEWGNPIESEDDFRRILGYSPYDNIAAKDYPAMLVTGGISDPRVTYWEPAKYVARLRDRRTNDAPLYLKTNMGAGHFGVSGRFETLRELAEVYAFVLDRFED